MTEELRSTTPVRGTILPGWHIFTLGTDHCPGPLGAYISILGCDWEAARNIVHALRGRAWAFQYSDQGAADYLKTYPESRCVQTVTITTTYEGATL